MHGHKVIVYFLLLVSMVDHGALHGNERMTQFSANSTCAESKRASGASRVQQPAAAARDALTDERRFGLTAVREYHRTPVTTRPVRRLLKR